MMPASHIRLRLLPRCRHYGRFCRHAPEVRVCDRCARCERERERARCGAMPRARRIIMPHAAMPLRQICLRTLLYADRDISVYARNG